MSKRLILILALAFVLGISFAAYAEVQNVKVSGDLTVSAVGRNNLDLAKELTGTAGTLATSAYSDKTSDIFSIAKVRVDADLTDNVSTTVRLLNERNWNGDSTTGTEANRNIGLTAGGTAGDENDIDLDLAFVTLKEFLYSPLSLTVGRQNLRFGNGWLVGDPDTNGVGLASELAEGDLSSRKSFDAVRATLDYNPLVLDLVYAKVAENNVALNDDTTLLGINANYALNRDTTLEGFFFSKVKGSNAAAVTNLDAGDATTAYAETTRTSDWKRKADKVHTVGGRVVNTAVKNLMVDLQAAYQFGSYNPKFDPNARYGDTDQTGEYRAGTGDRKAWGIEAVANYDLKDIAFLSRYSPSITGAYVYLSGESRERTGTGDYKGWEGMYEDQTFGHLINAFMGFSNSHLVGLSLQAKPTDDISLKVDYVNAWLAKEYREGRLAILSGVSTANQFRMGSGRYLGQELDATLTYNYTEDVQFSLLGGIFLPSDVINEGTHIDQNSALQNTSTSIRQRAAAVELIGSMKVTF